jgi:membrane protein DedA with SNARE-associated domain
MSGTVLAAASEGSAVGFSVLFGGVLLGSIIPVVPTGAIVGAAAAFAVSTDSGSLPPVLAVATVAALIGDLVTFGVCRFGGPSAVRWVSRGQHADRIDEVREQFRRHGWQIIVIGRLLPAGRIPVLLAAGALAYPWRRLIPASVLACLLWSSAYALLGVASGGIFDSPLVATLLATLLILVLSAVINLVAARRRRPASGEPSQSGEPAEEPARQSAREPAGELSREPAGERSRESVRGPSDGPPPAEPTSTERCETA